jgi:hypothetical protein
MQDPDTFEVVCLADFTGNLVVWRFANREGKLERKGTSETNEDPVALSQQALIASKEGRTLRYLNTC